ncbi:MAG: hypothetical protein GX882_01435 [Methanomicrobiales archaeon]|nr:hypothetical protein [Methanomicrobiales archaeon]
MDQKKCPFTSGAAKIPCMGSECCLRDCDYILKDLAKDLDYISREIQQIRRRVCMI